MLKASFRLAVDIAVEAIDDLASGRNFDSVNLEASVPDISTDATPRWAGELLSISVGVMEWLTLSIPDNAV